MSLVPRSLRGRTLLLVLAAMIACQALTLALLSVYRHNFLGNRGRDYMASHILLVRTTLRHASAAEVARELENAPGGRRMRLVENLPDNVSAEPATPDAYQQRMIDGLRQDYGPDAVRFSPPPAVALYVQVEPRGWWLMIPAARFDVPIPWTTVVSTLGAAGLMALFVMLYIVRLSRPLHDLAQAARDFDIGKRLQLRLSGPDEVRAVTEQFNAMAERIAQNDAERRVMLAGLPHDLRAPLARAKLRLAIMEESERSGFERDLAEIERIADQFVAYLRGLDRDTSRFASIDLAALLHGRSQVWQGAGQEVVEQTIDPAKVLGDAGALERAVDNLISNAFTHGAAPVVLRGLAGPESYRIEIEDCGPGIPLDSRDAALEAFVRLDSARGPTGIAGGHCGLGLAVVQAVSKLHGGSVSLANASHGGLIATISLPLAAKTTAACPG